MESYNHVKLAIIHLYLLFSYILKFTCLTALPLQGVNGSSTMVNSRIKYF